MPQASNGGLPISVEIGRGATVAIALGLVIYYSLSTRVGCLRKRRLEEPALDLRPKLDTDRSQVGYVMFEEGGLHALPEFADAS